MIHFALCVFKEILELPSDSFNTLGNMLTFSFCLAPGHVWKFHSVLEPDLVNNNKEKECWVIWGLDTTFKYFPSDSLFGEEYIHKQKQKVAKC